ncbi:hypothetical protein PSAC2689_40402 [Paraburkholderia sacchari]
MGASAGAANCRDSGGGTLPAPQAAHSQAHHRRRLALKFEKRDLYAQTCAPLEKRHHVARIMGRLFLRSAAPVFLVFRRVSEAPRLAPVAGSWLWLLTSAPHLRASWRATFIPTPIRST